MQASHKCNPELTLNVYLESIKYDSAIMVWKLLKTLIWKGRILIGAKLMVCRSGQGRHSMVFFRQVNMLGSIAYNIFAAVPFLYELRALLDWSCTATTLTLFDWLKLEDINTSLFLVTVNRKLRERRRLGQRQPRYLKFFQVIHWPGFWRLLLK